MLSSQGELAVVLCIAALASEIRARLMTAWYTTHRPVLPVEDPAGEEGAPAPQRQHLLRQVRVEVGPLAPQLKFRGVLQLTPLLFLFRLRLRAQSAVVPPLPVAVLSPGLGSAGLLLGVASGEGCEEKKERAG